MTITRTFGTLLVLLALSILVPGAAHAQLLADISHELVALEPASGAVLGKYSVISIRPVDVERPFTGVAFSARTNDADLAGQVRFLEQGIWSGWEPLHLVRSATDDVVMGGYRDSRVREGALFELQFTVASDAYLRVTGAGVFDTRLDDDGRPAAADQEKSATAHGSTRISEIVPPPLITRAEWNAEPFLGTPVPLARPGIDYMTFHHAAGFSATTLEEGLAQVKAIQDLHQNVRGWSDIGYQFLIDRSGRLYQGRPFLDNSTSLAEVPERANGAHVGGYNTGNIGVCILGCYHPPEGSYCQQELTTESYETYVTAFAFFSENYDVGTDRIRGHRDFSSTACPGDNNYALLPQLRDDAQNLKESGNEPFAAAAMTGTVDAQGVATVSWEFSFAVGVEWYRLDRTYAGSTVVLETGEGAPSGSFTDAGLFEPGIARYDLYVGNGTGFVMRVATSNVAVTLPDRTLLAEAYPNPFSASTTIRYFLASPGTVTLRVFNSVGQEVAVLADTYQEGDSWYTAVLPVGGLSAGTYFFQLRVEGVGDRVFRFVRSISLVR